jgi:hypothetical protein
VRPNKEGTAVLRRLQGLLVCVACGITIPAAAEEPTDKSPSDEPADKPADKPTDKPTPGRQQSVDGGTALSGTQTKPAEQPEGWQTFVTGYFRAPFAMGISNRPPPDNLHAPVGTQVSYGPNRTIDASYYSFAYTRLQEQDWAELLVHEKHKHVEAVVGWMGYWFQAAGFRNPDAAWVPGVAYVTLDTDFHMGGVKPNIALTAGSWWPKFGAFAKYDTYTLGRFRQMGEQLKLTVPDFLTPDLTVALVQGFGSGRDGSFNSSVTPPYQATVGLDLITYENLQIKFKKYLDIGLHFNNMWTADPNLTLQATPGKSYAEASQAHLTTIGAEATVTVPYAGRLWISPSLIQVKNGWALNNGGTEVMHSLGGMGIASNYLAWNNNPPASTGSGSVLNLGFLYEDTLSSLQGKALGTVMPEVTLDVFGLLADASLDLPAGSPLTQKSIKQFKYGADVTLQALTWLAFMLRYDTVNYDLDHPAYIFAAITPRVVFSSHFLSGESIYLQYSRYIYGDKMVLDGTWPAPWGAPLVAGSDVLQATPYAGQKPDYDVFKIQATIAF